MGSRTLSAGGLGKERGERRSGSGESWPLIERGFTEAQRKELEEQGVINRHLAAGLPVPLHLLLPIWKSVVTSNPAIYNHYPSFIGFILQGFNCRSVMDPEPGRCRRTDGKKWRCSRDVLSDQKYCERHIHRGRNRSRKLVEAVGIASPMKPIKPEKAKQELSEKPNLNLSVSVGLQLMTPYPGDANASCRNNTNTTINGGFSQKRVCCGTAPFISTSSSSGVVSSPIEATDTSNAVKTGQDVPYDRSEKRFESRSVDDNKVTVAVRNVSKVLGFSPTSVLQVQVAGSNGLYTGSRTGIELEPGRCRRTDGKKWRCRREVVTNQKYCPRHMHRGAKKLPKPFQPTLASFSRRPSEGRAGLSTDLCISVPTSPPPFSNDEKSICSISSDTTLSDSSISAYVISKSAS